MPTWTVFTTLPDARAAQTLSDALERLTPEPMGVGVFEMEDGSGLWEIGGYFEEKPDPAQLALLSAAFGTAEFVVSEVPETDWVAHVRRELQPVEAGRFFVYGGHDAGKLPDGRIGLRIEAAMAFGTGHHGTTLGCLRALDDLVNRGVEAERVADIGCGTAVLAMAAARVWPEAEVIASDIDAVAVEVADANLRANGLEGAIRCVEATGFDHPLLKGPFGLIFANILKGPLIDLAPDMAAVVAPGGQVILSGILNSQAEEVSAIYGEYGFNLVSRTEIVDWTTLLLRH
ncbi:50S ribosomal protein L11 methyltransferase [Ovoidimarina sediminis]|uniref:50S ribosomal protein L11 methyltransferase n=1 Tax=Ovoidimarina sediminis TaxID=3079856 RepID=UPI00290B87EA|nr:50S ribosomal protein L11 methyltransferase [Rhodophyticola sp. MJ-SS7]MDU8942778.1 50S ribosomal protein L11 methyltransferase [Rhodophyticola sp. MJ-SS7]